MAPTARSKRKHQQAELEQELLNCCGWHVDFDRVRELVEIERVSVECVDRDGRTPLLTAALSGHVKVARLLLENEANVHAADSEGKTAATHSVILIYDVLVDLLLEHGANVDQSFDYLGEAYSLLGWSMCNWVDAVVAVLLRFDANTEETLFRNKSYRALYLACWKGTVEIAQLLLDHDNGVDVNAFEPREDDAMSPEDDAMSPLCKACERNDMEMVQLLIQHGARVIFDGVYPDVPSPLKHAVEGGSLALVRFLLDNSRFSENENASLQPERIDNPPLSPALESALFHGKLDVAQLLVDRGANVNDHAYRFLWLVCTTYKQPLKSARFLLRAGANVNLADCDSGETPLWAAAKNGHDELVKVLLKAGADVGIRDNNGETPLGVARRQGHNGIVYLLLRGSPHV